MTWGGRKSQRLRARVLAEYGDTCHLCGMPGADTADHVIARAAGGTDDLDNLRPAHSSCNSSRQATPLAVWHARHRPPASRAAPSRDWRRRS